MSSNRKYSWWERWEKIPEPEILGREWPNPRMTETEKERDREIPRPRNTETEKYRDREIPRPRTTETEKHRTRDSRSRCMPNHLFQNAVSNKKIPESKYLSELDIPSMISMINDSTERARLTDEYFQWIDRAKADLINVMISASNEVKRASHKQFNDTLADTWDDQHRLPEQERLSTEMLRFIDQHQTNVTACVQYIYEFKSQFSLHVPPTSTSNVWIMISIHWTRNSTMTFLHLHLHVVFLSPIFSFYLRLCRSTVLARFDEINFTIVV